MRTYFSLQHVRCGSSMQQCSWFIEYFNGLISGICGVSFSSSFVPFKGVNMLFHAAMQLIS